MKCVKSLSLSKKPLEKRIELFYLHEERKQFLFVYSYYFEFTSPSLLPLSGGKSMPVSRTFIFAVIIKDTIRDCTVFLELYLMIRIQNKITTCIAADHASCHILLTLTVLIRDRVQVYLVSNNASTTTSTPNSAAYLQIHRKQNV